MAGLFTKLHGIMEFPWAYSALTRLSGTAAGRKVFLRDLAGIPPGSRVLEIGCGPGTNVGYFPAGIAYTGCDVNPDYIRAAAEKYGDKGTFLCFSVEDLPEKHLGEFDVVLSLSVLHHLDDQQCRALAAGAAMAVRSGGLFLAWEPCWREGQSWLDRFMLSIDRGRHVRTAAGYAELLSGYFPGLETEFLMTPRMIWPQSGCVMRARKK